MTSVGNSIGSSQVYHCMHHITASGKTESDVVASVKNPLGSLDKVFGAFLHGYTSKVSNNLFIRILMWFYILYIIRKWINGIMHSHTLARILMILIDNSLSG